MIILISIATAIAISTKNATATEECIHYGRYYYCCCCCWYYLLLVSLTYLFIYLVTITYHLTTVRIALTSATTDIATATICYY